VNGKVVSATGTASIVSETCPGYSCLPADNGCDEKCFWKTTGNHIIGSNNVLGTISNDDMRIVSGGIQRAVLLSSGELGIHTPAPSTTLDVDCTPVSAPSGLQFENLPTGQGNILVVDNAGYVYISKQTAKPLTQPSDLQDQINAMKEEINALKSQLALATGTVTEQNSQLSIAPNPTNGAVTISYQVPGGVKNASIRVTDITGRLVMEKVVSSGNGNAHLTIPANVESSVLVVSLVADGKVLQSSQLSYVK
jgi:hypothetical protein